METAVAVAGAVAPRTVTTARLPQPASFSIAEEQLQGDVAGLLGMICPTFTDAVMTWSLRLIRLDY